MSFLIVLFWLTDVFTYCNLLAFGLIAGIATEKNMTYAGSYKCYYCEGSTYPGSNQNFFDESKLSQEIQCSGGRLFIGPQ